MHSILKLNLGGIMMEIRYNKLLLIDGSHALHRSISQLNLWDMKNQDNQRTGGIYGMLNTVQKEISEDNYFPIVVFDGNLSPRRLAIYDNYKTNKDKLAKQLLLEGYSINLRPPTEQEILIAEQQQEYIRQREILIDIFTCLGIPVFHMENWEGDDLIYVLSKMTRDSIIVSDDRDMLQLICDTPERRCRVRRSMTKEFWDMNSLKNEGYANTLEYISCKAICGDDSDNIPQTCQGVGEKTALGLYKIYMYCTTNNIKFPSDDKELKTLCEKLNISKRSAYLNFDEQQFLTNMLLMDLSYVDGDVTDSFMQVLNMEMDGKMAYTNYALSYEILQEQNINSFKLSEIYNRVNQLRIYALMEDYNNATIEDSRVNMISNRLF